MAKHNYPKFEVGLLLDDLRGGIMLGTFLGSILSSVGSIGGGLLSSLGGFVTGLL